MSEVVLNENRLFNNKDLLFLFIPIMFEQFLEYMVGLADSIMVAQLGEAAVSGVSLIDFIMALLISVFAALATGGSIVAGQYLGREENDKAKNAAGQLFAFVLFVALVIMGIIYGFKETVVFGLFGEITAQVHDNANMYLTYVGMSIPFLATYNVGASILRTTGNAKLPMQIMLVMNLLNVVGNAVLVFVFHMGIAGIAIPTFLSRIGAAVLVMIPVMNKKNILHIEQLFAIKIDTEMLRRILRIGLPYGFESGMFFFGRLIVLGLVAKFGTAAIAANAVSGAIVMFQVLPGMSIGLGLTVIISRCIGAGDEVQAKYFSKKIIGIIYAAHLVSAALVLALLPYILSVYGLSPEATILTNLIVWSHGIMMVLIWPLGYTLPVIFRAAGDAKFPMKVSTISMIVSRIAMSYVICSFTDIGMFGTWVAMYIDWIVKSILFVRRYLSQKWLEFSAI